MSRHRGFKLVAGLCLGVTVGLLAYAGIHRDDWFEKRVSVVSAGRLVRGAWQRPGPLKKIIAREGIKTIVTLTAINSDDPKFVDQERVVRETGIVWMIIPMRGSRATAEQMALAADLLADSARQPVFFHCVAGHHRTSLVHAAYLIRHEGYTADQAWRAISSLSWARPDSPVDRNDRFLIEEFARIQRSLSPAHGQGVWEVGDGSRSHGVGQAGHGDGGPGIGTAAGVHRVEPIDIQFRDTATGSTLPVGTDAPGNPGAHPS